MTEIELALPRRIEHTLLRANATESDIRQLCAQSREFGFIGTVVNPVWVLLASQLLAKSESRVVTVVGFPLGANKTEIKVAEAALAVEDGAKEIDMVANIGWLCDNRFQDVEIEIRKIRRNLPSDIPLKVIVETPYLTLPQMQNAVAAVINGGAQYVKTCTGFGGNVTIDHVRTLVSFARGQINVKASGGIRTHSECFAFLSAGADRLGTSASVGIMAEESNARR